MTGTSSGAPDIELLDQEDRTVSLADFRGRKGLVFFYPKADTPGCTAQACGLRKDAFLAYYGAHETSSYSVP